MSIKKDQKTLLTLTLVSLGINFLMLIPFGKTLNGFETILKFIIIPVAIALINGVITSKKFNEYRPTNKFRILVSYLPIFVYFICASVSLALTICRANPTAVFSYQLYIGILVLLALVGSLFAIATTLVDKINLRLSKNQVNVFDVLMYVAMAMDVVLINVLVVSKYKGVALDNGPVLNIIVGLVFGAALVAIFTLRVLRTYRADEEYVNVDKQELIDKFYKLREETYEKAEITLLYSMHNYIGERLEVEQDAEEIRIDDSNVVVNREQLSQMKEEYKALKTEKVVSAAKHEKLKSDYIDLQNKVKLQSANAELEVLKKELEVISANYEKDVKEYEEELAELTAEKEAVEAKIAAILPQKVEEPAPVKEDKPEVKKVKEYKVPYETLVKFASNLEGEDLSVVANENGTLHKFFVGKKLYLVMQKTNSDYRITFFSATEDLFGYLQGYPTIISVPKSPKGNNWLRLVNTGDLEEEFMTKIIEESLKNELAFEKAELEAKEAEKEAQRLARETEKENRAKLRLAERIIAQKEREEERAARKAEREAEKEALKAEKEAEKEAIKAEKEAEQNDVSSENTEEEAA